MDQTVQAFGRIDILVNNAGTETESRKVDDLVGAVLFLSSHLPDMVVGHVLMVDGGWTIH